MADHINCDLFPAPGIDAVFDLMQPWPFGDSSCDSAYASHVLEHMPNCFTFFREAWRVLDDRRLLRLRLPYGGHRSAWTDPTHLRPWWPESFAFLQPGYNEAVHNPQHDAWGCPFLVASVGVRVSRWVREACRWRWAFHAMSRWLSQVPDAIEELWVDVYTLKSPESVAWCRANIQANAVPVRHIMYAHDWELGGWEPGQGLRVVDVTTRDIVAAF